MVVVVTAAGGAAVVAGTVAVTASAGTTGTGSVTGASNNWVLCLLGDDNDVADNRTDPIDVGWKAIVVVTTTEQPQSSSSIIVVILSGVTANAVIILGFISLFRSSLLYRYK